VRYRDGDLGAALALYQEALTVNADSRLALSNLAACAARLREHALAAQCYEKLERRDGADVNAALGHARALRALGRDADAALAQAEQRAMTPAQRLDVGLEYLRIGAGQRAALLFGADSEQDDAGIAAIARQQVLANDINGARARFATLAARAASRGDERARFRHERDAACALPAVSADAAGLARARADYAAGLGRLVDAWPNDRLRRAGVMLDDLACSRFLLAYQGADDRALAVRYGDWLAAAAAALEAVPVPDVHAHIRRIGLVSARWHQGTIAAYFGSWIDALRAAGKEVYFFSLANHDDATSTALAARASHAERLPRLLAAAAARLRDAALDLLIYPEVGIDGRAEVLAALRLAPRQWAAWGHPATTGLPTIDRFVSVATMEPPGAVADYREPLALLPGLGTCYAQPARADVAQRAQLGLPPGPLYALPHAVIKLHPDHDALLVEIARRDADACFLAFADEIPALTGAWRNRVAGALRRAGRDPERHLRVLPRLPIEPYRRALACVDIVIDSLHFSGGNTSLDALAQATPVVTIEGRFMRGRQTAAMLRLLDAPELIARDIESAASIATTLVHSPPRRAALSATLAANASRLFDRDEPLHALCELVHESL
jgi:CRISPR-associated protein Csy1